MNAWSSSVLKTVEEINDVANDNAAIGAGCRFEGKLEVPETLLIEGEVSGDVQAKHVKVGVSGFVSGNITATEAEIAGTVNKSLNVRQLLTIRSTGRIEGDVIYGQLELEKGAVVSGSFASSEARATSEPRVDFKSIRDTQHNSDKKLRLSYEGPKVSDVK